MTESEQPEIPSPSDVSPEEISKVIQALHEAGLDTLFGSPSSDLRSHPFSITIKLTDRKEIDVSVAWDCQKKNIRDIATVLNILTKGGLNKQILQALSLMAGGDGSRLDAVTRLVKKWNRIAEEEDEKPYVDPFQPFMPENR